jgi:hypothetical protein
MSRSERPLRLARSSRDIAERYMEDTYLPQDTLGCVYLQRIKQLPFCGIVTDEVHPAEIDLRHPLAAPAIGLRGALAFLTIHFAQPLYLLSDDVWFEPDDRANEEDRGVIRTSTNRLVFTAVDHPHEAADRHLSALLGFDYLLAITQGAPAADPPSLGELMKRIGTACAIAIPVHDGDTFLFFSESVPSS